MTDLTFTEKPRNRNTLEVEKFTLDEDLVHVRVLAKILGSVSGSFTPSGLSAGGKITEVALNSTTWTAIPPTPLTARNAVGFQNQSGIEIKINHDNSVSGYVGIKVLPGSERYYDITDTVIIYAKSFSGTPTIVVEEIA